MSYLLDTNVCIRYLNGRSDPIKKFVEKRGDLIHLCSIVKAELFYGAAKSNNPTRTLQKQLEFVTRFHSFSFDDKAADVYGKIRAQLEKDGKPIGPNDLMIAAISVANDLTLITHNSAEFSRVVGLKWEDWETPEK